MTAPEVRADVDRWLAAIRERHGDLPVHAETFDVDRAKYERMAADAARDAIGGARVRLARDDQLLLVSNRGEDGWDVPGGAREAGETLPETARREVREETAIECTLGEALAVNRFGFVPEDGDDPRVEGLWVYFQGEAAAGTLDPQEAELLDAAWFDAPPDEMDRHVAPLVEDWFEG